MKKLKFNYESLNAKLYRWFWFTESMPNICPYFWKSVIMWILMIPIIVLTLPYLIMVALGLDEPSDCLERILGGLISWMITFCAYLILCAISYPILRWCHIQNIQWIKPAVFPGVTLIIGICGIFGYSCIKDKVEKYQDEKKYKKFNKISERSPNLLIEGIKSFYHKYCPQIDWENTPNK